MTGQLFDQRDTTLAAAVIWRDGTAKISSSLLMTSVSAFILYSGFRAQAPGHNTSTSRLNTRILVLRSGEYTLVEYWSQTSDERNTHQLRPSVEEPPAKSNGMLFKFSLID